MWEGRRWATLGITPWPLTIWVHGDVKDPHGYGPVDRLARGLQDELFERGLVPRMTVSTYPPPAPPMLELHVVHWSVPGAGAAVALVSPIAPAVLIIVECKTHPLPPNPFDFRGTVYGYTSVMSDDAGGAAEAAGRAVAKELTSGGSATYPDRPYRGFQN
jgi:hypothetical protein